MPGTETARRLRREVTGPEMRLWARLRNRALHGCKFRRQMPVGRFVADFVCVEARLIVEIDGSQHAPDDPREMERTAFIESAGYFIMRFPNEAHR